MAARVVLAGFLMPCAQLGNVCRDLSVDDAVELARRSIYHATFRDAVSGGTVSGMAILYILIMCKMAHAHHLHSS